MYKRQVEDGKLVIVQEGKKKKFVSSVEQVTFSGDYARRNKMHVMFVTERAVIELLEDGLTVTEIAPGIDLQTQVLDQMDFKPLVAENLKTMDLRIFVDAPMGIKDEILAKAK